MACDLPTTQLAACESGIGKLDNPISLLQIIAQLSCEIADAGGGGGGTPGGAASSVQFNDAGAFGGSADFTFDDATNLLTVAGPLSIAGVPNVLTTLQSSGHIILLSTGGFNPPDSTTSYFGGWPAVGPSSTEAFRRTIIPVSGFIRAYTMNVLVAGTLGTAENVTSFIRHAETTNIGNTVYTLSAISAANVLVTGLNQAVTAGDFISFGVTSPAWVTNPTNVFYSVYVYIAPV